MSENGKYSLVWDLDSLLPNPESDQFAKIFDEFRTALTSLANESDGLPAISASTDCAQTWAKFLEGYATVASTATDLNALVGCHAAEQAENRTFQQWEGRLSALDPLRERIATNIEFAMKEAADADLEAFIAADARLTEIEFFLRDRRANATLRLPKEQEVLASDLSVDGVHAWGRLYDRISGALRIQVMERGEVVEKSPGQVQFDSPERTVRQNNFYASDKAWSSIGDTCADALNHISGTRLTMYRHLGLSDHLASPLRHNRMQRETLDAMWSAVSDRKSMLVRYFDCKAKYLGLKKLSWFDLAAPLPVADATESKLTYDAACDLVIDTFARFSGDFGDFARHAIEQKWIEVENRVGKRQGGFCTGFPTKRESRIFMTFTNTPDSMSTLAHELGHAYHSWVLKERPLFLRRYPMNLAETASTFAEAVLGEERLTNSDSAAEQLSILDNMLGDSVAFLMNIHARFLFEDEFHKERADGELTAERFSELMTAAQQQAYLGALDDDGWNPNFWISKLHFYISGLPFYNFPYTFGYLFSLGAYALAAEAGGDFSAQYRELLIATGCMETEQAVQSTLGYDLRQPDFWNRSLDVVEQRVNRFIELAKT
jgi:oligoendopeptidase F